MELIWQFTAENKNSKMQKPFLKLLYLQKKSSTRENQNGIMWIDLGLRYSIQETSYQYFGCFINLGCPWNLGKHSGCFMITRCSISWFVYQWHHFTMSWDSNVDYVHDVIFWFYLIGHLRSPISHFFGVSHGYTDHYQGRGQAIRPTAALINIHESLI